MITLLAEPSSAWDSCNNAKGHRMSSLSLSAMTCWLLLTFAISLDPDQAQQNIQPVLDPNCLILKMVFLKELLKAYKYRITYGFSCIYILQVLKRSPDLFNNVKISQGQLKNI